MRGSILYFSVQENIGYISGDDGKRYTFIGKEWKEQRAPQKGDYVDFDIDVSENAIQIFSLYTDSTDCRVTRVEGQDKYRKRLLKEQNYTIQDLDRHATSIEDREKHRERLLKERDYTTQDWWHKCLSNNIIISGRARRRELWSFYLCKFCILFILLVIIAMSIILMKSTQPPFPLIFSIFTIIGFMAFFLIYIALFLSSIMVGGRRLHDIGMSGWWLLLYLIPCGGFILLICFCIDTDPKENQWGLSAK